MHIVVRNEYVSVFLSFLHRCFGYVFLLMFTFSYDIESFTISVRRRSEKWVLFFGLKRFFVLNLGLSTVIKINLIHRM